MPCKDEIKKRKTYENSVRLARACKEMSNNEYTIYKVEENVFEFCRKDQFNASKGIKITDV